ncbi:MAG: GAF domain-containing sensor histidine kinase [Anaerolineales bacterium]|jgi:signal transduction histidine kinase
MTAPLYSPTDRIHRLERLLETNRVLSSTLDLEPLLQTVVDVASELTDSEVASLLLYDPEIQQLRFAASPWFQKTSLQSMTVPLDRSIAGQVFREKRPIVVQEGNKDPRLYRSVGEQVGLATRSMLAVPLVFHEQPIGVLEALNKRGGVHYTGDDVSVLETLAAQAAVAIENARLLHQVQTQYERLASLDQMKGDFIAIASHEFRTPLGLILGHAAYLQDGATPDVAEHLSVIIRAAERLKDILEELSRLTHSDQGVTRVNLQVFPVKEFLDEVTVKFKAAAKEKYLSLDTECKPGGLLVEADRQKMQIALGNLIDNAIGFTNTGGHVLVAAYAEEADAAERAGYVDLEVVDDGIGIPSAKIGKIFERFYQVENHMTRHRGGLGLGLSVSKSMAELHHGRIDVESVEGKGSRFCIRLPARQPKSSGNGQKPH